MILVEMVFNGEGGLEQLVEETAASLEAVLARRGVHWLADYPITLRESLSLGLQQQMLGAHACPPVPGHEGAYRIWIQLPKGGVRPWITLICSRILAGTGQSGVSELSSLRKDVQRCLVDHLGSCLERPAQPPDLVTQGV